jgi:hypothetical protein
MRRPGSRTAALTVLLLLQLLAMPAFAIPFLVSVDTSSLKGSTGFIDLQFNPADAASSAATASTSGFTGDLALLADSFVDGDVLGTLPGSLQLRNTTAFNSYFQAVQFGDLFRFVVDFSGDFIANPSLFGTSFSVSLLNDHLFPQLTNDVSGSLLRFELLAGSVGFQAFQVDGRTAATITPVPTPATSALFCVGMLLMLSHWALLRRGSR